MPRKVPNKLHIYDKYNIYVFVNLIQIMFGMKIVADNVKNLLTPAKRVLSRISHINILKLGTHFIEHSNSMESLAKNVMNIAIDQLNCDVILNFMEEEHVYGFRLLLF